MKQNSIFQPAKAPLPQYNALYILNQSDEKIIRGLIGNIVNVLNDPRLKSKLHIELVAFGDGIELYRQSNGYGLLLSPLLKNGVVFLQCINTLTARNISRDELHSFVQYTPSANGEIILRQYEGWATIKP